MIMVVGWGGGGGWGVEADQGRMQSYTLQCCQTKSLNETEIPIFTFGVSKGNRYSFYLLFIYTQKVFLLLAFRQYRDLLD